jgi:putative membrane protein
MIGKLLTATALVLVLTCVANAQSAPGSKPPANGTNGAAQSNAAAASSGGMDVSALKPSNMAAIKADDLNGIDVLDPAGQKIASINDVIVTPDGKVDAVIVDFGGFLGIGTKQIALAYPGLGLLEDANAKHYLVVNATKDQLNAQRPYNKDDYVANRDAERLVVSGVGAHSAAMPAPGASPAASAVTDPAQFAMKAGTSNLFEIQSSKLALTKSQDTDVKAFAQKMIDDHTKAGQDMQAAATAQKITPPTAPDATQQAKLDELNNMGGADFDKDYAAAQLQAHADAVALFQGYSGNGPTGALKDFATKTLPTLQMHYTMAQKLPK